MKILIINIKELIQTEIKPVLKVSGKNMSFVNSIKDAYLKINGKKIAEFGSMTSLDLKGYESQSEFKIIDAEGKLVMPCFCDSHTHLVYAGSRENEYVDKIKGMTYEEIAKRGGGILNSAALLHNTTVVELIDQALERLDEIKSYGTGCVEIKSGYGLNIEDELKMLRVIRRLKELTPLTIKSTFLGAHAVPLEYKNHKNDYVNLIIEKMLPEIANESLADFVDVFCDKGFFMVDDTERILEAAAKFGLRPKIHANELGFTGGVQAGVKYNALSVDHLEYTGDEEIELLKKSATMPTLLPAAAFFLGFNYPPARRIIDSGLPLALASDFNPGSAPSGNMQLIISLACIKLKMLPEEAINAVTINGAYAMDLVHEAGSIAVGKIANIIITKPMSSINYLPYSFGSNKVETIIINGIIA